MWGELEKCWQSNPDSRPAMTALLVSCLFNEAVVDEADEEVVLYPRRSVAQTRFLIDEGAPETR